MLLRWKHLIVFVGRDWVRNLPFCVDVAVGRRADPPPNEFAFRLMFGVYAGIPRMFSADRRFGEFVFRPYIQTIPAWQDAGIEPLTQ